MAKKNDLNTDNFDDWGLDEFNFDDYSFEEVKNDRNPVTDAAKSIAKGIGKGAFDESITNMARKALPDDYGNVLDTVDSIKDTFRDIQRDTAEQLKPLRTELKYIGKRLSESGEGYLPEKWIEKLKKLSADDEYYQRASDDENREADLQKQLTDLFTIQEEKAVAKEKADNVKADQRDLMAFNRHKDSLSQLDAIRQASQALVAYNEKINVNYQRKSLEIQMRHYDIAVKGLDVLSRLRGEVKAELAGIKKNTGLPEFVKIKGSEAFLEQARDKSISSLQNYLFAGHEGFLPRVMEFLKTKAKEKSDGLLGRVQDLTSSMQMASDMRESMTMMEEMGISKSDMAYDGIGSNIGSYGRDYLLKKLGRRLKPNDQVIGFGNKLNIGLQNLPANISQWLDKQDAWGYGPKAQAIDFLREMYSAGMSRDSFVKRTGVNELGQPDIITKRFTKSVIEVIPGYLSRILREVTAFRTGDDATGLLHYDHTRERFLDTKSTKKSIANQLSRQGAVSGNIDWEVERGITSKLPDNNTLNKRERKGLKQIFLALGKDYRQVVDKNTLTNPATYESLGSKSANKIAKMFSDYLADDTNRRKENDIVRSIKRLPTYMGNPMGVLQEMVNLGQGSLLEDMGILEGGSVKLDKLSDIVSGRELKVGIEESFAPTREFGKGGNVFTFNQIKEESKRPRQYNYRALQPKIKDTTSILVSAVEQLTQASAYQAKDETVKGIVEILKGSQEIHMQSLSTLMEMHFHQLERNSGAEGGSGNNYYVKLPDIPAIKDIREAAIARAKWMKRVSIIQGKRTGKFLAKKGKQFKDWWDEDGIFTPMGNWVKDKYRKFTDKNWLIEQWQEKKKRGRAYLDDVSQSTSDRLGDIYVGDESEPRIRRIDLVRGRYIDKESGKPIRFVKDITGPVVDQNGSIIISADEIPFVRIQFNLKERAQELLSWSGNQIQSKFKQGKAYLTDRYFSFKGYGKELINKARNWLEENRDGPQDVYLEGEQEPVLTARLMQLGKYFDLKTKKPIKKIGDITGPVVDEFGNILITTTEFEKGLFNKHGQPLGDFVKAGINFGLRQLDFVKNLGRQVLQGSKDFIKRTRTAFKRGLAGFLNLPFPSLEDAQIFAANASGSIVQRLDKIYALLEDRLADHSIEGDYDGSGLRDGSVADIMKKRREKGLLSKVKDKIASAEETELLKEFKKFRKKQEEQMEELIEETDENGDIGLLDTAADFLGGGGDGGRGRRGRPGRGKLGRLGRGASRVAGKAGRLGKLGTALKWATGYPLMKGAAKGVLGAGKLAGRGTSALFGNGLRSGIGKLGGGLALATTGYAAYDHFSKGNLKEIGGDIGSLAGGFAGMKAGAAVGAGLGSFIPLVGTAFGGLVGGIAGGIGGYFYGEDLGNKVTGMFKSRDDDWYKLRAAMYGFSDVSKINELDVYMEKLLVQNNIGLTIDISKASPGEVLGMFGISPNDKQAVEVFSKWFNNRFKPNLEAAASLLNKLSPGTKISNLNNVDKEIQYKWLEKMKTFREEYWNWMIGPKGETLDVDANGVKSMIDNLLTKYKPDAKKPEHLTDTKKMLEKATAIQVGKGMGISTPGLLAEAQKQNALNKTSEAAKASHGVIDTKALVKASMVGGTAMVTVTATDIAVNSGIGGSGVTDLDAIRMKAYGLSSLESDKINQLKALEESTYMMLTFDSNTVRFTGNIDNITSEAKNLLSGSEDGGIKTWVQYRFLPVYVTYMNALFKATGKKDLTTDTNMIDPAHRLVIAEAIKVAKHGDGGSIWSVTASPWNNYPINIDSGSIEGNYLFLKDKVKSKPMSEQTVDSIRKDTLTKQQMKEAGLLDTAKDYLKTFASGGVLGVMSKAASDTAEFVGSMVNSTGEAIGNAWDSAKEVGNKVSSALGFGNDVFDTKSNQPIAKSAAEFARSFTKGLTIGKLSEAETAALATNTAGTESNYRMGVINGYGYAGLYQFGAQALEDIGFMKRGSSKGGWKVQLAAMRNPSNWNHGLSLDKFLNSRELQDKAYVALANKNIAYGNNAAGKRQTEFQSAIGNLTGTAVYLKMAHLKGAKTAVGGLLDGKDARDGSGTSMLEYGRSSITGKNKIPGVISILASMGGLPTKPNTPANLAQGLNAYSGPGSSFIKGKHSVTGASSTGASVATMSYPTNTAPTRASMNNTVYSEGVRDYNKGIGNMNRDRSVIADASWNAKPDGQDVKTPTSSKAYKAAMVASRAARVKSSGYCARYVANALQGAGYQFQRQPSAYMYAENGIMSKMGFTQLPADSKWQVGDVMVWSRHNGGGGGGKHGHIQIYDGKNWLSDFRQNSWVPGTKYRNGGSRPTLWRDNGVLAKVGAKAQEVPQSVVAQAQAKERKAKASPTAQTVKHQYTAKPKAQQVAQASTVSSSNAKVADTKPDTSAKDPGLEYQRDEAWEREQGRAVSKEAVKASTSAFGKMKAAYSKSSEEISAVRQEQVKEESKFMSKAVDVLGESLKVQRMMSKQLGDILIAIQNGQISVPDQTSKVQKAKSVELFKEKASKVPELLSFANKPI